MEANLLHRMQPEARLATPRVPRRDVPRRRTLRARLRLLGQAADRRVNTPCQGPACA